MVIGIIDYDPIIYAAASVGEERYVKVLHKPSGLVKEFSSKTAFHGRGRDKDGGWLGALNAERAKDNRRPFLIKEFEIEGCQRVVEPIENVLHTTKTMVQNFVKQVGADKYLGYIGGTTPLNRLKQSTLLEYKGNRRDLIKPILKDEVTEYLIKHHNAILVKDGLEADDWCIIKALEEESKGNKSIVITSDKDVLGNPVLSFNPNRPDEGVRDGNQFGEIYLDSKKEVRGIGRMFKYFQVAYGDPVDNYKANAQSDVKWGAISAFKALKDCKSDKEAFGVLWSIYNTLYPEPKEITTWRGDKIEIDALHCLQEMWDMAHMLRHVNDRVSISEVLQKFGIIQ